MVATPPYTRAAAPRRDEDWPPAPNPYLSGAALGSYASMGASPMPFFPGENGRRRARDTAEDRGDAHVQPPSDPGSYPGYPLPPTMPEPAYPGYYPFQYVPVAPPAVRPPPYAAPPGYEWIPIPGYHPPPNYYPNPQVAGSAPRGKSSGKGKGNAKEDTNALPEGSKKVFVGGLPPSSSAESLIAYFSWFGAISDAAVVGGQEGKKNRGFGFVEFRDGIPPGLLGRDHIIDKRRCGVRVYDYNPEL